MTGRLFLPLRPRSGGFTLVEMIMALVVLGIVAGMVAVFIRAPILGYRDSVDRAEMTDQADLALRRLAREIRLALPNSVRVSADGSALEFLQTRSGGRYFTADELAPDDLALALKWDTSAASAPANLLGFSAFAPLATFGQVRAGDYVVVYNLGPGFGPADAYGSGGAAGGNIAQIDTVAPATHKLADGTSLATYDIRLKGNPFPVQAPQMPSPAHAFQVVSGAISFYCQAGGDGTLSLWRAWNYGINGTQQVPPAGGSRALVATRLTQCAGLFNYSTAANQRTGLVGIALEIQAAGDSTAIVRLVHQVHVDNTP